MISFIQQIQTDVEEKLETAATHSATKLDTLLKSIGIVRKAIESVKTFLAGYIFTDAAEEITFFKEQGPKLYAQLIYFSHVYQFESKRGVNGSGVEKKLLEEEVARLEKYILDNRELYSYYHSQSADLDEIYFKRASSPMYFLNDEDAIFADYNYSTTAGLKVSRFIAYELLQAHFSPTSTGNIAEQKKKTAAWTDAKSGLIELMYALYATGAINNGKATVKDIAHILEQALNVDLSNYYRAIQNMRIRKINRTKFLDLLKLNLEKYMDETDDQW